MEDYSDWVNNPDNIKFEKLNLTRDGKPLTMKTELYEHLALSFYEKGHRHHDCLFAGLEEETKEAIEAGTEDSLLDELSDILWYITTIAHTKGSNLESLMMRNINKLERRKLNGKENKNA